jgi:DNA-binding transcriptional ArsR family regulator
LNYLEILNSNETVVKIKIRKQKKPKILRDLFPTLPHAPNRHFKQKIKARKNNDKKNCETNQLHIYLQLIGFVIKFRQMRRDVFQAIADPTRRAIIALIALQAMTPNTIAENFNTTRQAVSKHLRILTECQLVTQEQRGREIYYSLDMGKMKEMDNWLAQFRDIWETRFNQLDKVLLNLKLKENEK